MQFNFKARNRASGSLRQLARQWKLGTIAYRLYYRPKDSFRKTFRRGLVNTIVDTRSQRKMEQAAYRLSALPPVDAVTPLEINFLTGDRFWYQTVFCAYSMAQHSNVSLRPIIYDDGSLIKDYQNEIYRVFPNATIHLKPELDRRVETHLPKHKFPYLRERRENYPNIRKLTDIHIGSSGWKLVLDSDMLFFNRPDALLSWLKQPTKPCHMVDTETSYGYSNNLMQSLAGASIANRVNVGICGLNSDAIDWEKLEYWCKTLIEKEGTHYYQEQALIAMLMADEQCQVVSQDDYIVMPNRSEVLSPKAILHHYVADSKPWYFRHGWRQI